ncbi:MAG: N-succinylarginine dihydrolase [Sphingopyxis sp.]|nr:N-succinylarginine dihydrolase [Sphingopyxis sp.]
MITEINFDGIIGPSHNYAGLSPGNIASANNAGAVAHPRQAALQGLEKMRANLALGLPQGWFMPLPRPDLRWLDSLATDFAAADPHMRAAAMSASAMWAANAATVSPASDTSDGRCHLTVANLVTMAHRSHEWPDTLAQLRIAFADDAFRVHAPVPPPFGDEGAANHMRLAPRHDAPGVEIFVYGTSGGAFPARQHIEASRAIARRHGLAAERTIFIEQSPRAIASGAFHNDVVAVANERILFVHETAFADRVDAYAAIKEAAPWVDIVEVPEADVPLADVITSYLFNAQLVTLPTGEAALIVPTEATATPSVKRWLDAHLASNGAIRRVIPVDVRQSMANGGGPACLRLRVVANPDQVDQRFICTNEKIDRAKAMVAEYWPESIAPDQLGDADMQRRIIHARERLLTELRLGDMLA